MKPPGRRVPVTVVIPCYCCDDTIERAVHSVLGQTARPSELILVDDGSPDDGRTADKLRQMAQAYREEIPIRIIVLGKNGGPAAARNAAWEQAGQPYVAFLDADDSWYPEKLQVQYGWMQAHPDVALSGHICASSSSPVTMAPDDAFEVTAIDRRSVLLRNPFSTPSVMLKAGLPVRFLAEKSYAEDFFLWQQLVCAGYAVVRLEITLARLHKAAYGEAGLSSRLWEMERAELDNYRRLRRQGCLGALPMLLLMGYSLAKYARRVLIVRFRGQAR